MDIATKRHGRRLSAANGLANDRLATDFQAFVGDVEQDAEKASRRPGDGLSALRTDSRRRRKPAQPQDAGSVVASGVNQRSAGEAMCAIDLDDLGDCAGDWHRDRHAAGTQVKLMSSPCVHPPVRKRSS
jgi:hypothetical protein